ncbi:hypothetical protein C0J52_01462 [Blattella germanica]|nr:hypothetical protein C0J52_01462 [Blattella germanica]
MFIFVVNKYGFLFQFKPFLHTYNTRINYYFCFVENTCLTTSGLNICLNYGARTYNKFMALQSDLTSYNLSKYKLTMRIIFREINSNNSF